MWFNQVLCKDAPDGKYGLCLCKPDLWVALPEFGKFQQHGTDGWDCTIQFHSDFLEGESVVLIASCCEFVVFDSNSGVPVKGRHCPYFT